MIHHVEVQVLILLLIAALVGMGARRLKLPYTLALVLAGLALGFVHLPALAGLELTPELLMLLFLPPLLFEAAFNLHLNDFRKDLLPILYLAVPGVAFSVVLIAVFAHYGVAALGSNELQWGAAFVFAAVISATDPISVLALFKEVGAPRRLYTLVEGESLINDGVAVVAFTIVLTVLNVSHGGGPETHPDGGIVSYAIITFIRMAVGGVLIGSIIGAGVSVLTRQIDDHLIEVTLTTLVAWGSFLVAEQIHVSGVLSTVAAGVVMGSYGGKYGMSPATKLAVEDFWEYMGFLSNSFIFLLIGLELEPARLITDGAAICVGFLSVMIARAVVIYGSVPVLNRFAEAIPRSWQHVMVWGGLRGSLSMVLVIGLPSDFPGRAFLLNIVFGIVALSLFGQGLSMAKIMRKLGVGGAAVGRGEEYEVARGTALAAARVIKASEEMRSEGVLDERTHERLHAWYQRRWEKSSARARTLAGENVKPERMLEALKALAAVERARIRAAADSEVLSEHSAAHLLRDIDLRITDLSAAAHHSEAQLIVMIDELLADDEPSGPAGG